jgi:hypothetical protein
MALPKAVQRQAEEADRLVRQISGEQTEQTSETINQEPEPELQSVDVVNDSPEPLTQEVEPPKPVVPEEKWEHKYLTLKGMYDAEVPRLHAQVREMGSQIQNLIAESERAKVMAERSQPEVKSTLITDEDKEAFGPDLIDLIERATESKVSILRDRESQLMDEIKQLKGQLGSVSERQVVSDKDRFTAGLTQRVPDWEALNVDQGFLNWLQQVDPVYGLPRQVAITNAYEQLDVDRVATIFDTYKQLIGTPKPTKPSLNPELQRQVAPTRSRASTTPTDSMNQKIFTQDEIARFYDEWRRGYIDNEDAVRIEKDIHAAISEGRIR